MDELSYEVPDVGRTEKFYKRSQWWIAHRTGLKKIGLGLWIALDVFLVLFALWVFVDTFLIRYEAERGLLRSLLVDNPNTLYQTSQAHAATPVTIDGVPTVLASGDGAYDFVGFMTNPNSDWWAEVVYQFTYGADESTPSGVAVLYPRTTQPILSLGVQASRPTNPKLRVLGLRWHRVDPHVIADFTAWKGERLAFTTQDASFSVIANGGEPLGRSSFTVTNDSAFGYWEVPLAVILRRGSAVVGVSSTVLEQFEAGETRKVDLTWFEAVPQASEVEVVPLLNIFDDSNILPPRGQRPVDTRVEFGQ